MREPFNFSAFSSRRRPTANPMTLDGVQRCATAPHKMADSLAIARWSNQWTHDPILRSHLNGASGARGTSRRSAVGSQDSADEKTQALLYPYMAAHPLHV